jgi:predicted CXXCH cytochrome family protein
VRFCLLRKASVGGASRSTPAASGLTLHTRRLTIGSGPNQHLQLTAAGVDERHAVLTAGSLGGLRVTAVSGKGIGINGRREIRARLKVGDVVQVGAARLTVRPSRSRRAVILEVNEPPNDNHEPDHERADVKAPGPRMSPWSWALSLGFAALFLLLPLSGLVMPGIQDPLRATPLLPSDALWSPGPLHTAHQSIGTRCDACHVKAFEAVRDRECLVCHASVQHHVDVRTADVSLFHETQCTACHLEHKQPAALVQRDPRVCTDCHADLGRRKANTGVRNATDFGTDHPEFRLTVLASAGGGDAGGAGARSAGERSADGANTAAAMGAGNTPIPWKSIRLDRDDPANFVEHSHLRFSHLQHLDPKGVKAPTGERILGCQDCHKPNSSGRDMLPIRMEIHCSGCHSLLFDEHDPTSGVPHGNIEAVYKTLREHFSHEYLVQSGATSPAGSQQVRRPGNRSHSLTEGEQRRARDWVDTQSLKIARELLEKRVCADCHEVTRDPSRIGLEQWRVEPVQLTADWMPRARFDHAAHVSETCVSCHGKAPESKHATDILIPDIARCRECHGGSGSSAVKVASDCLMCHAFHIPSRGLWLRAAAKADEGAR